MRGTRTPSRNGNSTDCTQTNCAIASTSRAGVPVIVNEDDESAPRRHISTRQQNMKRTCSKFERKWNDDPALNILLNDGRNEILRLAYLLLSLKMMNLPQDGIFPHDNKL
jgi:hypothetical protein